MRRCSDCAKWRENRGYCPIYAARKSAAERMCKWMAHEQYNEYSRKWMAAKRKGAAK